MIYIIWQPTWLRARYITRVISLPLSDSGWHCLPNVIDGECYEMKRNAISKPSNVPQLSCFILHTSLAIDFSSCRRSVTTSVDALSMVVQRAIQPKFPTACFQSSFFASPTRACVAERCHDLSLENKQKYMRSWETDLWCERPAWSVRQHKSSSV